MRQPTEPPALPKATMTKTARQSKWLFWSNAFLGVFGFVLFFVYAEPGAFQWLRLALVLIWCSLAVAYFRSWRAFKRSEVEHQRFRPRCWTTSPACRPAQPTDRTGMIRWPLPSVARPVQGRIVTS